MNFATWSIRNPIPAILLFALLALAGRSHQRGRQVLVIRPPRASWFLPVDEALTGLGVPVANAGR